MKASILRDSTQQRRVYGGDLPTPGLESEDKKGLRNNSNYFALGSRNQNELQVGTTFESWLKPGGMALSWINRIEDRSGGEGRKRGKERKRGSACRKDEIEEQTSRKKKGLNRGARCQVFSRQPFFLCVCFPSPSYRRWRMLYKTWHCLYSSVSYTCFLSICQLG